MMAANEKIVLPGYLKADRKRKNVIPTIPEPEGLDGVYISCNESLRKSLNQQIFSNLFIKSNLKYFDQDLKTVLYKSRYFLQLTKKYHRDAWKKISKYI